MAEDSQSSCSIGDDEKRILFNLTDELDEFVQEILTSTTSAVSRASRDLLANFIEFYSPQNQKLISMLRESTKIYTLIQMKDKEAILNIWKEHIGSVLQKAKMPMNHMFLLSGESSLEFGLFLRELGYISSHWRKLNSDYKLAVEGYCPKKVFIAQLTQKFGKEASKFIRYSHCTAEEQLNIH
jgi:hypothetical protein